MLHDQGLVDHAVSVQSLSEGRQLGLMFARPDTVGNFDARAIKTLNAMRGHIVRAGLVATRLGLERARSAADAIGRLGLAALVIDRAARVIAANALAEAMPSTVRPVARGGLRLADALTDRRFRDAVARIAAGDTNGRLSIPVRADDQHGPHIVHMLPLKGRARDIFADGHILIVIAPVGDRDAADLVLLQGLFDLTPAEARLASALLGGGSLTDVASRTGVSHHTLRVQLRAVMAKTGVRRQADLTKLLATI